MVLRYKKGSTTVAFAGTEPLYEVQFSPYGEVEDKYVDRLMKNRIYGKDFEIVEEPEKVKELVTEAECDVCHEKFKNKNGLRLHSKKHKEKTNEVTA